MYTKRFYLSCLLGLTCLSTSGVLSALPSVHQVIAGSATSKELSEQSREIHVEDRSILEYETFVIGEKERLSFVQSSKDACVLNRIRGQDPAQIFGQLESNGKVFLVSPSGIYFGPEASVHVGSLIASTLDLSNDDFLSGRYTFTSNGKNGLIRNEGLIESLEGSMGFVSSQIENTGSILAKVGSVSLVSGDTVTLDFTGEGLMSFSVEGEVKEAVIEQAGSITSSVIEMKLPLAQRALAEMVNLDGEAVGDVFVEEAGVIKLVSSSQLIASQTRIEAETLKVEGSIDGSSGDGVGGSMALVGSTIDLKGALLDVSGKDGGGSVLIGGEFQGQGQTPWAQKVTLDSDSKIYSNALLEGDGGLVVLWSSDLTLFQGVVESKGGAVGGSGGMVETSSQKGLYVDRGKVDTLSPYGQNGTWLLDPNIVSIDETGSGCSSLDECGSCSENCTIAVSTINSATSDIYIKAYAVVLETPINMTEQGVGIRFDTSCNCASPDFQGVFFDLFNGNPTSITTNGGDIIMDRLFIESELPTTISLSSSGGNIQVNPVESETSLEGVYNSMVVDAGSGAVLINVDSTFPISFLEISSASQVTSSNIVTAGPRGFTMPLTARFIGETGQAVNIDTSAGSGPIEVGAITSSLDVTLNAGTGPIVLGDGFTNVPAISLTAGSLSAGSIIVQSGNLDFSFPVTSRSGTTTFSTSTGNVSFSSLTPEDSGLNLTIFTGSGSVTLPDMSSNTNSFEDVFITANSALIGPGITTTGDFTVNGGLTVESGALDIGGSFFQVGSSGVSISQNITAGEKMSFEGMVTFKDSITLQSQEDMTFSGALVSDSPTYSINFDAGSSTLSTISVNQVGTQESPFGSLELIGNTINANEMMYLSSLTIDNSAIFSLFVSPTITGDIIQIGSNNSILYTSLAVGGKIIFSTPVTFKENASSVSEFSLSAGTSLTFGDLEVSNTAASLLIDSDIFLIGDKIDIKTSGGDITFTGSVLPNNTLPNLTVDAKEGSILAEMAIGSESQPFNDIIFIGCPVTYNGAIAASGDVTIENCSTLTLPSFPQSFSGDFIQSGPGSFDLAYDITADQVLFLTGPGTVQNDIELTGLSGLDSEGPLLAGREGLSLFLNAPNSLVRVHDIGRIDQPFDRVWINSERGVFKGQVFARDFRFNGLPLPSNEPGPKVEDLYSTVPKNLFFVPGLYSSWDTFYNKEYFFTSPPNFSQE